MSIWRGPVVLQCDAKGCKNRVETGRQTRQAAHRVAEKKGWKASLKRPRKWGDFDLVDFCPDHTAMAAGLDALNLGSGQ